MGEQEWDKYHEGLLKRWAQMSKTYAIMHSLCARHYAKWHTRLGVPVVILGGATASSIFSSTKEQTSLVWTYVNGILAMLVAALAGVSNFIGAGEKTTKHQNASYKYHKIGMDIDARLAFRRHERIVGPHEFIQAKKAEILEIRENGPEILPRVMESYLRALDKSLTNTKCKVNRRMCIDSGHLGLQPIAQGAGDYPQAPDVESGYGPPSDEAGLFGEDSKGRMSAVDQKIREVHGGSETETESEEE